MNSRQHAFLARALQDACGGADHCVELLDKTAFAMGRTAMYDCRDPGKSKTMPAGAITHLELIAQKNIYTSAMLQARVAPTDAECAVSEACEASETMATVQAMIRRAGEDKIFTENEKREIEPHIQRVESLLAGVRTAMEQAQ